MGVKLIYSLLFTFCLERIKGLSGITCKIDNVQVCCSNFENVNGVCTECKIGYTSNKSDICSRCKSGWHGYKCVKPCHCLTTQRCDHVKGCVDRPYTDVTTFNDDTNTSERFQKENEGTNRTSKGLTLTTPVLFSTSQLDPVTVKNNRPIKSSTEIIIYCVSVGGLLLVMCVGFAYQRYRLKQQRERLLKLTEINSANLLMEEMSTANEEEHYHYIDENRMVDPEPSGGYLEVVNSSSDTSIHQNVDGGYLHPYNALSQPSEAEVHIYLQKTNTRDDSKSSSSGSNTSLPYTDKQGYFHMYHKIDRCKSLPRDYESTTPQSHIARNSNYNYSKNCQPERVETIISIRNFQAHQEQEHHILERTEPQCNQKTKEVLLEKSGLLNKFSNDKTKKNLTL